MKYLWILLCACLTACSSLPSPETRRELADSLAAKQGWQAMTIPTTSFRLLAYLPHQFEDSGSLAVYIEGDGFAWMSASQPSPNPTPLNPVGLRLALAHPQGNAAYLARPCQYLDTDTPTCRTAYWTSQRFAPELVAASNQAIDQLKTLAGASRITLVGFSGGGAIAALIAARRNDVTALVTVAGNMDHEAWTRHHRISPLKGSLNPAHETSRLDQLPQVHFIGGQDRNITLPLMQAYTNRFSGQTRPVIYQEPDFDHQCCWAEQWPSLWQKARLSYE